MSLWGSNSHQTKATANTVLSCFAHKAQKNEGRFHALFVKAVLSSNDHVAQSSAVC